jgi:hypothetical protein
MLDPHFEGGMLTKVVTHQLCEIVFISKESESHVASKSTKFSMVVIMKVFFAKICITFIAMPS